MFLENILRREITVVKQILSIEEHLSDKEDVYIPYLQWNITEP